MISTIVKIKNMRSSYRTNANFLARLADAFARRVRPPLELAAQKAGASSRTPQDMFHRRV
jgi:hypothetical protein